MLRARARAGTAPEDVFIASGISLGSYRAVPATHNLGGLVRLLKARGKLFDARGQPLDRIGDRAQGKLRQRGGGCPPDLIDPERSGAIRLGISRP